jgi:hypothetical protein
MFAIRNSSDEEKMKPQMKSTHFLRVTEPRPLDWMPVCLSYDFMSFRV